MPTNEMIGTIPFEDGSLIVDFENKIFSFHHDKYFKENKPLVSFPNIKYTVIKKFDKTESYFYKTINSMFDSYNLKILANYLGSILVPQIELHVILGILGRTGREGKGSLLEAIGDTIGEDLTSSLNVGQWNKNHETEAFVNSILNISSEVSTYQVEGETFKSITGGDSMTINPKNRKPFKYKPLMRHLLSFNKQLKFKGLDNSIMRRLRIIEAKQRTGNDSPFHKSLLRTDKLGTIHFLLDGLCKFVENNGIIPEMAEDMKSEIIEENNLINSILSKIIEPDIEGRESLKDIHLTVNELLWNEDAPRLDSKKIKESLENYLRMKNITHSIIKPQNKSTFKGIRLVKG
jgi:phage/plasmid-associated DNA primase